MSTTAIRERSLTAPLNERLLEGVPLVFGQSFDRQRSRWRHRASPPHRVIRGDDRQAVG